MSSKDSISHPGVVENVRDGKVFVKILSKSACASCNAQSICSVAEMEEKIVEVRSGGGYKLGEQVTLNMEKSLGTKAVMLGYVVPFLVLFIALIVTLEVTGNEGLSALISIGVLIPYYIILYLLRDKLSSKFVFRIE
jgi:sigma-E factor negative regulatory protein RseC